MTIVDLQHCVQRPDESAHHWSRRVAEIIHSSDGITAAQAVLILEHNCHYEPLVQKLGRLKRKVQDMGELMDTLTRYAEADDTKDPGEDGKGNSPKKGDSTNKHTRLQGRNRHNQGTNGKRRPHEEPSDLVANTNANDGKKKNRGFSGKRPRNYEELLKGPCPHHATADGPAGHSWENCFVMREFRAEAIKKSQSEDPNRRQDQLAAPNQRHNPFGGFPEQEAQGGPQPGGGQYPVHHHRRYNPPGVFQQQPPQGAPQDQDDHGGFRNNPKQLSNGQYHVFTTNACRRDKKVSHRAYSVSEPALPRYLHWSEQTITWSREDHPPRVDNPGDLALVVAPQVGGYTLSKVLMDGGSSINILYFDTFQRMNLLEKDLMPSTTVFHGIVPGKSAYPIGRVRLTVAFRIAQNYRSE